MPNLVICLRLLRFAFFRPRDPPTIYHASGQVVNTVINTIPSSFLKMSTHSHENCHVVSQKPVFLLFVVSQKPVFLLLESRESKILTEIYLPVRREFVFSVLRWLQANDVIINEDNAMSLPTDGVPIIAYFHV